MKKKIEVFDCPVIKARLAAGFPKTPREWQDAKAIFSKNELRILGHPVMERWETEYMEALATIASSRGGRILEIGFGMGISATFIQRNRIQEHVVIEANKDVFSFLLTFVEIASNPVLAYLGFWQDITCKLQDKSFSGILFDTYPLCAEEIHSNHFPFFPEAYRLLQEGGVFTYYSDEAQDYSPQHRAALEAAGFTCIQKKICQVSPPSNCEYWRHNTILAPIVIKDNREGRKTA